MTKLSLIQNMRWLNSKAKKNNWNYPDLEKYIEEELGLDTDVDEMGNGWRTIYAWDDDGRLWCVSEEWEWSDKDTRYFEKKFDLCDSIDHELAMGVWEQEWETEMSRPLTEVIVERNY